MLTVSCSGTPYEIGHQHGSQAREQVLGTMAFYKDFFMLKAKLEWEPVCAEAARWKPLLERDYPQYLEEMQGIADAAEQPLESILALNIRTEVAFGLFSDGCTSVAFNSSSSAFLAQNWDWNTAQTPNLINLAISAPGRPSIAIITEAGIIGKIGLSSAGVGVCLNAIAALGVDHNKIPVHVALRAALDWSAELDAAAIAQRLEERGVASAAHILLAAEKQAFGLEFSALDCVAVDTLKVRGGTAVVHSNHYIKEHPGVKLSANFLADSPERLKRIEELIRSDEGPVTTGEIKTWLCDEQGFPGSICRDAKAPSSSATLFSIVMDLKNKTATVREGKPIGNGEVYTLAPK